jgi:hypothetical protein
VLCLCVCVYNISIVNTRRPTRGEKIISFPRFVYYLRVCVSEWKKRYLFLSKPSSYECDNKQNKKNSQVFLLYLCGLFDFFFQCFWRFKKARTIYVRSTEVIYTSSWKWKKTTFMPSTRLSTAAVPPTLYRVYTMSWKHFLLLLFSSLIFLGLPLVGRPHKENGKSFLYSLLW